ncbi:sugar ABC transporter ATP-binding protein [Anaerococcus sp. AGMB09787]|uniref:sugar ABC transporter ATP-binding protein n=1 Tax=Anaerococcus sp. AGMB09787 TaxID=2922869 RepID=UPI001FAE8E35|nr:sugar ABC transporter ATP-binding protein [Anaerococcus sp. AGMB09787]
MRVELKDIYKSFGNNDVLRGVDFDIREGEIHALVGENGAGKSTLMNIFTGLLPKDSGEIYIDGRKTDIDSTEAASDLGIRFIHQELVDYPQLTVVENLFMNKELKKGFFLDYKKMEEEAREIFRELDLNIGPNDLVKDLSIGQRQMLEIAKANMGKINILILDEPTTALTNVEIDKLFKLIKKLKDKNVSMIYISHRMEEIFALTDRVSVMRDGKSVGVFNTSETNESELVKHMVGRSIGDFYPTIKSNPGKIRLEIKNFTRTGYFEDINLNVRANEVIGIGGLMGAGRSEIFRSVFGIDEKDSGEIFLDGEKIDIKSPSDAMKNNIAFLTENRKEEGLILNETIRENISLTNIDEIKKGILLDLDKEKSIAENYKSGLKIKCEGVEDKIEDLSGGNQQKVVLAKWLGINPKVLILDEPTKGVDVGAKREIYDLINKLVENGQSVILISSDLPELLSLSDRIYVIYEGKLQGEIGKNEKSQERVMTLATGGKI